MEVVHLGTEGYLLFQRWLDAPNCLLLNQFSLQNMRHFISSSFNNQDSQVLVFQIGPSFSSRFETTAPKDQWLSIIRSLGLTVLKTARLAAHIMFDDNRFNLIAAHWSKYCPYKDGSDILSPNIYAVEVTKATSVFPVLSNDRHIVGYSSDSAQPAGSFAIYYLVHFFQDLVFLRGLVSRWGSKAVKVIVNNSNFAFHHLMIVQKFLNNHCISSVNLPDFDRNRLLPGDLLFTSTLGPQSPMHFSCSRLIEKARERRVVTVTLQHGITLPDVFCTMTEYTCVWNEQVAEEVKLRCHQVFRSKIFSVGNVKPVYCRSGKGLSEILGSWVQKFSKYVMVATNLHWANAHNVNSADVRSVLEEMSRKHPEILFFVRPHPEDCAVNYGSQFKNVLLIDDVITGLLDISVDQILVHCHLLLSTYSTLLYDAHRNNVPARVFGFNTEIGRDSHLYPELAGLQIVKNDVPLEIDTFFKGGGSLAPSGVNDMSFDESISVLFGVLGEPLTPLQSKELKRFDEYCRINVPDYGRTDFRTRLENNFVHGGLKHD
ncbi:hypothetical protein AJE_03496 [Alishewanella jeotgali KCTC 22429]|uniref:Uncharacterized protein n=1 Tax=Alishewanella jeotgali KCTC 22429 TaxID=1129374 RepID=H3ZBJ4_9ALTE|nr:hypothetical protein AJE_03496 [Alishewanella jeotgali KCTC 22429]